MLMVASGDRIGWFIIQRDDVWLLLAYLLSDFQMMSMNLAS